MNLEEDIDELTDEESSRDLHHFFLLSIGIFIIFTVFYCGGWNVCSRMIVRSLDKGQRMASGRSKFGDGYKLLPSYGKQQ